VLDGLIFEKKGIPAVAIITEPFIGSGNEMAKTLGQNNYKFAVLPHPIASTEADKLQRWVEGVYANIKELLVK
jgi:hypothetical protein